MNKPSNTERPDYSRFYVSQSLSQFTLMDQETGWVWKKIRSYRHVLLMMMHILNHAREFKCDEYKRIRRLEGDEWERDIALANK